MEKLKTIAKSIWAKIPKTKTEFKDLFDKCVSYYEEHKAWIHRLCLGIIIALWGFILLAMLSNFFTLYFSDEETPNRASEVRLAIFTLTAWIGAPFLVWRTMIASKQATIAQEKSYTELFTQAIEQLGSVKPVGKDEYVPNIEVRVGAIYALGRIMHDSDKDAKTIIDTLTTYVKHNCGEPKNFEEEITQKEITELRENPPANRYDIQTALKIIGRRPEKYKTKGTMLDLRKVNLQGANLVRFDLSFCDFEYTYLEGANLPWTNLREAELILAKLQGANLYGAKLQGADLKEADLKEAELILANLKEANLRGANLRGANLYGANLYGAKLQGADLKDVQITDAHKTAASVIWVDFTKTKYDFDILQEQVMDMYGHKTKTILPEGMKIPDHWSEADMATDEGREQYYDGWEAFKKEKGVE